MKRASVALLAVLIATSALASERQRYLVATRRPFAAGALKAVRAGVDFDLEHRSVSGFRNFTGFAADLTPDEVQRLRASREVRWVEPNLEITAHQVQRNPLVQSVPYGVNAVSARPVRLANAPRATVNVVVVDTGIDYRHPELAAVYAGGKNVIDETKDPLDDNGHGTHVAGTIAAADNDFGVIGVAHDVRLWAAKVLNSRGSGTIELLLKGVDWIESQKVALGGNWVVNMSLGSSEDSPGVREAFQRVADKGVIFVGSAGNGSTPNAVAPVSFPAAYPSVLATGAVNSRLLLAGFSSQGPEVDFAAPGVGVWSTMRLGENRIAFVYDGFDTYTNSAITGSKMGTATGEYVYCGLGNPEEFPASVNGRIALIRRGSLKFFEKARNAKLAGATGVIIFNNEAELGNNPWTLNAEGSDPNFDWPLTVRMTKAAGELLAQRGRGTVTIAYMHDDYESLSGTSMAAPHVAGAVAALWSLAPEATPQQLIAIMTATAHDLGELGHDSKFGNGLINVYEAARQLAPGAFAGVRSGRPSGSPRGRR